MDVTDYRLRKLLAMAMDAVDLETQITGYIRQEFVYTHELHQFLQRYQYALTHLSDSDVPGVVREPTAKAVAKLLDLLAKESGIAPATRLQQPDASARLWRASDLQPYIALTKEIAPYAVA